MKTQEELKQIKEEYELLANKLHELSEDELKQVIGGGSMFVGFDDTCHFDPPVFSGRCVDCPHYVDGVLKGNCRY